MMRDKFRKLALILLNKGLLRESDVCFDVLRKLGTGSTIKTNPYTSIVTDPMDRVSGVLEQECDCDFDAEQCPVCGRLIG